MKGGKLFLPDKDLKRDQNLVVFVLWSDLERVSFHLLWACWLTIEDICSLRMGILGWVSIIPKESHS